MVKVSEIEIPQIGSVVLWTKNMDQNLPFSFALSIFPSCVCFGICSDPEEKFTCGEVCLQVQAAPFVAQMLSITDCLEC